jgi:Undecaprenyl-phosphate glucose phosphotransferase
MTLLAGASTRVSEIRREQASREAAADARSSEQSDGFCAPYAAPTGLQLPCSMIGGVFALVDSIAILLASLLGAKAYQFAVSSEPWNLNFHIGAGAAAALLYLLIGRSAGFYQVAEIFSASRKEAFDILWHWLLTSLLLSLLAFIFRIGIEFSRGAIICFFLIAAVFLLISRNLMKTLLSWAVSKGRVQGRRVVLIGLRDELAAIGQTDLLRRFGLTEVERVALPSHGSKAVSASRGVLTSLDDALLLARDRGAEQIVLALCWNDTRSIELIRDRLRSSPLPIQLLPDQKVRYLIRNPVFSVSRSFSIEIQRTPLSGMEQLAKRVFDIVGASVALVTLTPLMLLTALTIKLDSRGPVLFRQRRSGFNAKRFLIFKFRTMTVMEDGERVSQAIRRDPRITRFGAILRATSIDELPQLLNVLRGEMSLVGPRPHAVAHDDQYGQVLSDYAYRHHVKPGITGWAQINGMRGETPHVDLMKRRLDLDIWYISNWNIWLDFLIVIRTFAEVVRHRNAY